MPAQLQGCRCDGTLTLQAAALIYKPIITVYNRVTQVASLLTKHHPGICLLIVMIDWSVTWLITITCTIAMKDLVLKMSIWASEIT